MPYTIKHKNRETLLQYIHKEIYTYMQCIKYFKNLSRIYVKTQKKPKNRQTDNTIMQTRTDDLNNFKSIEVHRKLHIKFKDA